jgi:hypothetical protein
MIRRGFWLTAGAVTGIYGYRRVSAVGRRLSASLTPGTGARIGQAVSVRSTFTARQAVSARHGALRLARETYRFTRDVREGMELYRLTHSAPAGSTLSTDRSTDHDIQPEDGH